MSTPTNRLLTLDVFRGITIAGMILVNTIVVSPWNMLDHSEWNGCTLADLVFPFFLVVMGVSLVFSLRKQDAAGLAHSQIIVKIIRRTMGIFILGMVLNIVPYHMTGDTLVTVRVYGVLQRIAICYFFSALCSLYLSRFLQVVLIGSILIGYWALMVYSPVPHYGMGDLSPAGNIGAYLDRLLFNPANLYGKVYDPEGLLSTLPAIASTLLGNLIGFGLLSRKTSTQKCFAMLLGGLLLMGLGWVWGHWFPINKNLWTSSFALWTAGLASVSFAFCYGLIEIKHIVRWSKPFEIFGLNAIAAYFLHVLCFKLQLRIHLSCGLDKTCNLRQVIIKELFGWMSLPYASLSYAVASVLFWLLILTVLYKKRIFIHV